MASFQMGDKQDRSFAAHIEDLFRMARERYVTRFTLFMDLHQQAIVRQVAAQQPEETAFLFFGGYPEAERTMAGIFAPFEEPSPEQFPLTPVTIQFRQEDALGHRDILGALLGLQLERETVGDILLEKGRAVCFLTEPSASVVLSELSKAGRYGVKTVQGDMGLPFPARQYQEIELNISSLRLDCFTSALAGVSREAASRLISGKQVAVNGMVQENPSGQVPESAVLSLRGYGKFQFIQVLRATKKGRLAVLCKKYV